MIVFNFVLSFYSLYELGEFMNASLFQINWYSSQLSQQSTNFIELVDLIIEHAVNVNASDIHFESISSEQKRIRLRIDGQLYETLSPINEDFLGILSRIKILANLDLSKSNFPQDGHFQKNINNRTINFRVSTIPTIFDEKIVVRILDSQIFLKSMGDLGFTHSEFNLINEIIHQKQGLVLVNGPTGCGKTTTLYALLQQLNQENINISTIEDPVEINIPGINQTQVNEKVDFTFEIGLRSLLRQDPDVLMVGEIRDINSAFASVRASLTGHLVFSTLHTQNAVTTMNRLVEMGIPDYLVSNVLSAIISQRLIRKLCPHCKTLKPLTKKEQELFGLVGVPSIYSACGCEYCHHTGYSGRIGVYEILKINQEVRNYIQDNTLEMNLPLNMTTLKDSIRTNLWKGNTSIEEALMILESNE